MATKKINYTMKNRMPMVSVTAKGDIRFNKAAKKRFGLGGTKSNWARLYMDKDKNQIGISFTQRKFAGGFKIQKYTGDSRVSALSLFKEMCEDPSKKKGVYKMNKYISEDSRTPDWFIQF